ncbi:glycosyltransferase [Pusillimonas sp. TS35]|uniref:glycosyltransferase n=1 Tax=Paracandidimonas lactea TaxID=2895524 RepID=UPI00136D9E4A|nr:glycosyltransferase [Paracandidimonas lactea]MYN13847.1 glycosyltransferase [Pusillimonas sp. TS35]
MKILVTNSHNLNGGGHVTYIKTLLEGLSAHHDMAVATPATSRLYAQASEVPGVKVHAQMFTTRASSTLREVFALRRLIQRERFDVIHVNGPGDHRHAMLATLGMRRRPAIVWTKHNTREVGSFGNRVRAGFGTDACIAVSDYVADMLQRSPYVRKPVFTVRHGIDMQRFPSISSAERAAARAQLLGGDDEGLLVLGSVAGTDTEKGWIDLVRAVAGLEPALRTRVRIIVAGDPPCAQRRAAVMAEGMSAQVVFPGLLRDIRPVLAASDAGFVLSYAESSSYACLEMMACGLPLLVSGVGGLPENVRHGQEGWVVPVGDTAAIAQVVCELEQGSERVARMGTCARDRVAQAFGALRACEETSQIYHSAQTRKLAVPRQYSAG